MKRTYWFVTATLVLLFLCGVGSALAEGRPFITKWNCKKGKEVPIPIIGTYKMLITDASGQEKVNETVTVADALNPYIFKPTEDGIYTVTAGPEGVERIQTENRNYLELIEVVQFGTVEWTSMKNAFQRCLNMTFAADIDIPNLSKVTNMSNMFFECKAFNSSLKGWDVSHVTNMWGMFYNCTSFNQSLTGWDVSHVTNMSNMFSDCTSFNQSLEGWDVSHVTNMWGMFYNCTSFNQSLTGWDVSHVTNMSNMFSDCTSFNQSLEGWDVSNVTDMSYMFSDCTSFNQSLTDWDVSKVTNMLGMFSDCTSFNQSLEGWDVSNVTDMRYMFSDCTSFNQSLGAWKIKTVVGGLGTTAMNIENYSKTLVGWAEWAKEANIRDLNFNKVQGRVFNAKGKEARQKLIDAYGWKFEGDRELTFEVTLVPPEHGTLAIEGYTTETLKKVSDETELTITATTNEDGYELKEIQLNGKKLEGKTFTVKADTKVTAVFGLKTFPVTASVKDGKGGEVKLEGAANLDAVEYGTKLTVVATPDEANGYKFKAVTVNGTPLAEGVMTFVVKEAKTVEVEFALKTFPVTKELKGVTEGEITITGATNLDAVEYGTELTVEATTTEEGYELKELQVNGKKLEGTKFTVKADTKVTAVFGLKTFPVTASVKDGKGGEVKLEGAANLDAVEYGTKLTVVATPDEANGYKFKAVTVNGTPLAEGVMTFVVKEAKTVEVEFALKTFPVTKELKGVTEGEITITGATNLDAVEYGTELTVEATTTEEGYELKELQVNGKKLEGTKFTVKADTKVTAVFGLKTFPVTASVKDGKGGEVKLEGAANLDAVEYGTKLTVVATPDEANGYKFKAVTVNGTPLAEGVMTFVVKEAKTVEVEFALKTFPVTKELKGVTKGEITITGATNLDAVEYGTELTVEATTTEEGYELKELQVNGTKLEGKTFKVTGEAKVTAVFGLKTFKVDKTQEGEGTLTITGFENLEAVPYGTELTVSATPNAGYELKELKTNDVDIKATMKFKVTAATTVTAVFEKKQGNAVEDAVLANISVAPNPFSSQLRILNPEGIAVRYELVTLTGFIAQSATTHQPSF